MTLSDDNIAAVYEILEPLQAVHLSRLLDECWEALPSTARTRLVQLRRSGKEKDRVVAGCSSLAAGLAARDVKACTELLSEAMHHAKGGGPASKAWTQALRRDWLSASGGMPFQALRWDNLGSHWRMQFLFDLRNVINGDERKARPRLAEGARQTLLAWLRGLANSPEIAPEDSSKVSNVANQLDPTWERPAETEPATPTPVMVPGPVPSAEGKSIAPVSKDVATEETDIIVTPDQAASIRTLPSAGVQPSDVTAALTQLSDIWQRYAKSLGRSAAPAQMITQVRELEEKVKEANRERDSEIANNQQLKRNLASAAEGLRRAKGEATQLGEQLTEVRTRLVTMERLAEKEQAAAERLRQQVQELQNRLAGQEEGQVRHLQATLKEERRVFRVEIAQAIQSKVKQIHSLGGRPATPEMVEAYRVVLGGLLGTLESQGISVER
jgi:hypothetical protein